MDINVENTIEQVAEELQRRELERQAIAADEAKKQAAIVTQTVNNIKIKFDKINLHYTALLDDDNEIEANDIGLRVKGCFVRILDDSSRSGDIKFRNFESHGDEIFANVAFFHRRKFVDRQIFQSELLFESDSSRKAFAKSLPFATSNKVVDGLNAIYQLWQNKNV
jgi:hypothetical protein